MKFKNERPLTTWSLHGWNPICFPSREISTSLFARKECIPGGCYDPLSTQIVPQEPPSWAKPLIMQMEKLRPRVGK